MRTTTKLPAAVLALAAALVVSSCTTQGLVFVQDDRLSIVSPDEREEVSLPFRVEWTSSNDDAASFMVFVDRSPMPPGKTIDWFGETDSLNGVYPRREEPPLRETSVLIDSLPPRGDVPRDQENRYEITVIWLDEQGRRVSETADFVTVIVEEQ